MTPLFRRSCATTVLILGLVLLFCSPAFAHGDLESTVPAAGERLLDPPSEVSVELTEPAAGPVSLVVTDRSGARVPIGDVGVEGSRLRAEVEGLPTGSYTVNWAAMGADGHVAAGEYTFSVGSTAGLGPEAATAAPPMTTILGRFLVVAGALLWTGAALLLALIRRGRVPIDAAGFAGKCERFLRVAVTVALVGEVVNLVANMSTGLNLLDPSFLIGTTAGLLSITRWTLLASALLLVPTNNTRWRWHLVLSLTTLVVLAFSGHATQVPGGVLVPAALDMVHLVAAAAWIGGIVLIGSFLRSGDGDMAFLSIVKRFSPVALGCVLALSVTGVIAGRVQTRSSADLSDTLYGRLLVAKSALVVMLLVGGAITNLILLLLNRDETSRAVTRVRAVVRAEALPAAGILVCVAMMTSLTPPRLLADAASLKPRPVLALIQGGDTAHVAVLPGTTGPNVIDVAGVKSDARSLRVTLTDGDNNVRVAELTAAGDGYSGEIELPSAGRWALRVADRSGTTDVDIAPSGSDDDLIVTPIAHTGPAADACRRRALGQAVAFDRSNLDMEHRIVPTGATQDETPALVFSPCGTKAPDLRGVPVVETDSAAKGRSSWSLRPDPSVEGAALARLAAETLGARTATVAYEGSNSWPRAARQFAMAFEHRGGVIVRSVRLSATASRQVEGTRPDVLVLLADLDGAASLAAQLEGRGWRPQGWVMGGSALLGSALPEAAPEWRNAGIIKMAGYFEHEAGLVADYVSGSLELFPEERPSIEGFIGYVQATVAAEALDGSLDDVPGALASYERKLSDPGSFAFRWSTRARSGPGSLALFDLTPPIDVMRIAGHGHQVGGLLSEAGDITRYSDFVRSRRSAVSRAST